MDDAPALQDVHAGSVTVLITALTMPRMSGLQRLQAAKAVQPDLGSILITGYASTGGWILATRPIADLYSSTPIVPLTPAQQQHVAEAAEGTYRPCCNNSTAFADCNHGMAMLGLFELMASQGATTEELFEAAKYINAFWFPQQTFDVATYFKLTTGQDFAEVDGRTFVGPQFMSGQGWSTVRQWLKQNGQIEQVPGGGGCGV